MKKITLLLCSFILLIACESYFLEPDLASTDPMTNFEYLWNECNEKYSYFELKGVDWDEVKVRYSAQISEDISEDSLFNILAKMLIELKDDHTNLVSNFNVSRFDITRETSDNFDFRIVEDNYLPRNYYRSGPFAHDFIDDGTIGYIRFPEFTGTVDTKNLDFALDRYKDTRGLVLDIRENGGGAVTDVFSLISRFISEKTLTNYSRIKSGPGRNDFSSAEPVYVSPNDGVRYEKKVVLLTDRGTYSAGSFTSLAMKAIPSIIQIGDTTGGGLGLPNGGQLPNGWIYRFSISQALTLDLKPDYENGVPPDIAVALNRTDITRDEILDRAIEELKK
ncbi:S41 family peptidase [Reichenbachiella versicolor]|uniref:S41 family peptidase n=1 Tax=Reichenbachiella versicolor TaxID=1821036 RepID=UPI000D6E84E7|nr:S41 family peptidase [Reichenbachiella versicolor]